MGAISHHKVVAALPNPLEKDSVYFVRAGTGFDIYVTNSAGTVAASALNADALVKALGTASARDTGTGTGQLGINGAFGWGGTYGQDTADCNGITIASVYRMSGHTANAYPGKLSGDVMLHVGHNTVYAAQLGFARSGAIWNRYNVNGTFLGWASHYTTRNTTVDANGFLKAASPIARVSDSAIEGVGALEKLATGHYRITQTQGLRLGGGWYIETPHDRNGDKYFNVEWYQNTEPLAVDGFLDEEVDGVVIDLHCFERVWNPATGRHENGGAVDIPTGRWIDLRFNELKPDEDELDELVEPH